MRDEISVRQWQERYRAGAFDAKDMSTQCKAGWYDWFCQDEALAGRLKKIARVVMGITDPFILDNYYVWFKNNCPVPGPLYDDVRFDLLAGERDGKYFVISLDSPHHRLKWSLTTERFGFDTPEFECRNVRDIWTGKPDRECSMPESTWSQSSPVAARCKQGENLCMRMEAELLE